MAYIVRLEAMAYIVRLEAMAYIVRLEAMAYIVRRQKLYLVLCLECGAAVNQNLRYVDIALTTCHM